MRVGKIARLALFTAIALLMHLLENMLPSLFPFAPGVKMGLSNVVTLIVMIIMGYSDAYIVLVIRCVLGSVFGGNITSIMYSLPAGLISLTVQILMYQFLFPKISLMAISFTGAVVHNVTQIAIYSLVVKTNLIIMLPFTLIASIIAGLFVGIVAFYVVRALPKKIYLQQRPAGKRQNKS